MKKTFYSFCLYCVSILLLACNNVQPGDVFVEKDKYSVEELRHYSEIVGSFLNFNYNTGDTVYMINEKGENDAFEVVAAELTRFIAGNLVYDVNVLWLQNTDLGKEIYIWSQINNDGKERYMDIAYQVRGEGRIKIRAEGFDVNQDVIRIEDDIILTLKKNVGITYIGNKKGNYHTIVDK